MTEELDIIDGLIKRRRSVRQFTDKELTLEEVKKLVEIAYFTPSAGGVHPLSIYAMTDKLRKDSLCKSALCQEAVSNAAVDIVIVASTGKMIDKYKSRGLKYIYMEAGHSAQNIALTALAMGYDTVMIGAFNDDRVRDTLELSSQELPLYIICIGEKK